jgi:hypothetical protein
MSEYIEIETEMGEDPAELIIHTNLRLADQGLKSIGRRPRWKKARR